MVNRSRSVSSMMLVAVALVLAAASTAFACTQFLGQMTVTQGATSKTNVGDPNASMVLCVDNLIDLAGALDFGIALAPATGTCAGSLPNGEYTPRKEVGKRDCMSGTAIGPAFSVSSGSGSTTITGGNITGATTICAVNRGAIYGMEMRVNVI